MGRRNRAGRGGGVKLSELDAITILRDERPRREIARRHRVSLSQVCRIKRGKRWEFLHHVPGPPSPWLRLRSAGFRILSAAARALTGLSRNR